jgi:two-component system phosphate regulon sensor histidine kinase PhoR
MEATVFLGNMFSAVLGVLTALLSAVVWCCLTPPAQRGPEPWAPVLLAAAASGLLAGLVSSLVLSRYRTERQRLVSHIEALGRGDAVARYEARLGLQDAADAAAKALTALRERAADLVGQKRELEVQLRISDAERRHGEAILNTIADGVLVTDAFNELALANESAARLLNFEVEPALRRPVDQVIGDPVLVKLIKDTREGGDTSLRRHVEHQRPVHGQPAFYDVTLTCVAGGSGQAPTEPAGVVTILRDITREKEISETKSDFVSAVSHELRTPLSSIKAYVEMLVDGEATDEQTRTEFYNIIQGEANRLSRLIDNVLNIGRIESGMVKVQREHISLPALVHEVVDVMQPQARAKQMELVEVPTPLFFQVFADRDMIYQAILNLVGNAIKYTNPGGKVTVAIGVDEHAHMVQVAVSDTGVGVPPEALSHLFEKFYRVAEHKKMAKGTGLGLNLVKQIVETVHGGKVHVASTPGKGSTFTFSLPMADNNC